MCGDVSHVTTPPSFAAKPCGIPTPMWYCLRLPWCHDSSSTTGRRRNGQRKNVRKQTSLKKNPKGLKWLRRSERANTSLSFSASAPQNTSPAPVSISANQTGGYTAARRAVSMPEQPITIVILLIYRSLGAALPPKYHTDRRGVRWESITLWTLIIWLQKLWRMCAQSRNLD